MRSTHTVPIMTATRKFSIVLAAALAATLPASARGAGFVDVLDTKATMSPLASRSLLQAVTLAGDRLIAVGPRGHIVVSADGGATWKQSPVPVSSDLTSVYFVDAKQGWVVGHDGVVLHTADGGDSWQLQLDGRKANALLLEATERAAAAQPASEDAKRCWRRPSATRSRAPTSRSSTSGSPTRTMATWSARTT